MGPFEVLALIGKGGMGEVYRDRDTKLKRDVAIKVLPDAFSRDPDRMARFQREAEVLASLNHPNIAHIYGVEDRALVMELVEGESPKGPMPFEDAWKIAMQIADALEYAHDKSVIHRDLKPANVKVTPDGPSGSTVKLLDFGLAKAYNDQADSGSGDPENSPTLTIGATVAGTIMGTAAYMAPEQAKGKRVDKRADIWSWGVMLCELLTGERLFKGADTADTLAQVLTKEPDLDRVPPQARKLLRRCLEKDPRQRLRDIGEARHLLAEEPVAAPSKSRPGIAGWIAAAVFAVALAAALALLWPRSADRPMMRLNVDLGPDAVAGVNITAIISPDGTRLVYLARGPDGKQQLATRLLDQAAPTFLRGTENATDPFFKPDGQWIGFFADGKLKKITIQGGPPVPLGNATRPMGASWAEDGSIVAALRATDGLARIPDGGGTPQRLTTPEHGKLTHRYPQVLNSGDAVLFTASLYNNLDFFEQASIEVLSFKTGAQKTLVPDGYFGRYLPTNGATGHLIYIQQGTLFAVPFDPARLELRGTPTPLFDDVAAQIDFSRTGTFLYGVGNPNASDSTWPVMWLDRSGKMEPLIAARGFYATPRFSPDGKRLALRAGSSKAADIYVSDLKTGNLSPVTFDGGHSYPVWTPDGKHLVFGNHVGDYGIWWIRPDGSEQAQRLLRGNNIILPSSFSHDGQRLAYIEVSPETGGDIWTLPLDLSDPEHPKPGTPEPLLQTRASEIDPAFSLDGRWMAYSSDESGRREIYVQAFHNSPVGLTGKWQISTDGGGSPIWSRDGHELFFTNLDHRIMVAAVTPEGTSFVRNGEPALWSPTQIRQPVAGPFWALHPEGKRFAVFPMPEPKEQQKASVHITFLLNFFDELRRRAPEKK